AIWILAEELGELDRVTVGFPGVVTDGVTQHAIGLGTAWAGFDLGAALQQQSLRPARVVDDADLVAHAAIAGAGVELVITIGARFAAKLFLDGKPLPGFELGAHRFRKKATYADYVAGGAFAKHGRKKWNARVRKVIASLLATFAPTKLYLGGRDARFIYGELPANVEVLGPPSLAAALWLWA
ncbi:MAG: ROK family protein, partial [Kofleriaceae bacterium]